MYRHSTSPAGSGRILPTHGTELSYVMMQLTQTLWDILKSFCVRSSASSRGLSADTLLGAFGDIHAPCIVLACKSELEEHVPSNVTVLLKQYDVGLIQVSVTTEDGKERLRKAFQWIFRSIARHPGATHFRTSALRRAAHSRGSCRAWNRLAKEPGFARTADKQFAVPMGHLTGILRDADGVLFDARVTAALAHRAGLQSRALAVDFADRAWVSFTSIRRAFRFAAHAGVSHARSINK